MSRKNIEQARASKAFEFSKDKNKEYAACVNKLPMYVKTNGLLNTFAFMYSKKDAWKTLFEQICEWLTIQGFIEKKSNIKGYMDALVSIENPNTLIAMTNEVLAIANWLRRFAKQ